MTAELGQVRLGGEGTVSGGAVLRDVTVPLGQKVTEDGQNLGGAEELAAELEEFQEGVSRGYQSLPPGRGWAGRAGTW